MVDWDNEIIQVTSPTTAVAGQVLHDFIEDAMATPEGLLYGDIIDPQGKIEDPSNPGVYSQIIIIFNSPWQVQFWGGSGYTRIYGAKVVGGLADEPMKATGTAGDISVLESPVDGVTVVYGSGVTSQDKVDIADEVWIHDAGLRALGLMQENQLIDNYIYDSNVPPNMTSARMRLYDADPDVGNVIATYNIIATWTDDEMQTYKVEKV